MLGTLYRNCCCAHGRDDDIFDILAAVNIYVHFMDIFPMTASQKIQKYKLRELAAQLWPNA